MNINVLLFYENKKCQFIREMKLSQEYSHLSGRKRQNKDTVSY
jgi:hypothetical protein